MQSKTFLLWMILAMPLLAIAASPRPDLESLVNNIVDEGLAPGAALVIVQDDQVVTAIAAGYANPDLKIPMTIDTPLRIASNTKPYVSAALIQIAHQKNIDLKTPIKELLVGDWNSMLVDAGYDTGKITLNHVLTHSAGFRDHSDSLYFKAVAFLFRDYTWTPEEQLQSMIDLGGSLAPPGEIYSYSDSGYLILGQIIESLTNQTLSQNVRYYGKLDQLGLNSTWWEVEEAPRGDLPPANQYISGWNMTNINPTIDLYGGGGLMASTRDLGIFFHFLFSKKPLGGRVFANESLQLQMLSTTELPDNSYYAKGIKVWRNDHYRLYSHDGFWGTLACHIPEINTTIAAAVTDQKGKDRIYEIRNQLIKSLTNRLLD